MKKTDMNFFEEIHLRGDSTRKKNTRTYSPNFKTGLLVGALSIVAILVVVSFQNSSKEDPSFETLALHLDSIQIQQNARMIQLLEVSSKRDTTIVHIVAPAL